MTMGLANVTASPNEKENFIIIIKYNYPVFGHWNRSVEEKTNNNTKSVWWLIHALDARWIRRKSSMLPSSNENIVYQSVGCMHKHNIRTRTNEWANQFGSHNKQNKNGRAKFVFHSSVWYLSCWWQLLFCDWLHKWFDYVLFTAARNNIHPINVCIYLTTLVLSRVPPTGIRQFNDSPTIRAPNS